MSATAQEILDALNDAILAKLTGGAVRSYSIGNRNIQYMSLDEMRQLRSALLAEVAASNGSNRNYGQFVRPI